MSLHSLCSEADKPGNIAREKGRHVCLCPRQSRNVRIGIRGIQYSPRPLPHSIGGTITLTHRSAVKATKKKIKKKRGQTPRMRKKKKLKMATNTGSSEVYRPLSSISSHVKNSERPISGYSTYFVTKHLNMDDFHQ